MDGFETDAVPLPAKAEPSGQIILVLRNLLGERYPELGRHVNQVAALCWRIAPEVGLEEDQRKSLTRAAFLHDIGKLSLPESMLQRAGPLTAEEWSQMRLHTVVGEQILLAAGIHGKVLEFVRSSHERVDGTGYPDGLADGQIPLGSKIIAVCDAFEAMTSPRPYRPTPMTHDGALLELMRASGTQFDEGVVDALCQELVRARTAAPGASTG
jgi:HD-GYP domain-containing protein (c-di-GMP phosphodiesterase class II)